MDTMNRQKRVRLEWCKARRHLAAVEKEMFSLAGIKDDRHKTTMYPAPKGEAKRVRKPK